MPNTLTTNIKGPAGNKGATGDTGSTGSTAVSADAGNKLALGSDAKLYNAPPPLANASANGSLSPLSGAATDFVNGTNAFVPIDATTKPLIWDQRMRSFNSVGNRNFECDQRKLYGSTAWTASAQWACDRWLMSGISIGAASAQLVGPPPVIPGTTYLPSSKYFKITLNTASAAALPAGMVLHIQQSVEGCQMRELWGTHSLSLMVNVTRAGGGPFTFSVGLRDPGTTYSLVYPCTVQNNTWTVVTLPNLPSWTGSATWNLTPGNLGYYLNIVLACGSTYATSTTGSWVSGNFVGASSAGNFINGTNGDTFSIAYVQHEPNTVCTPYLEQMFPDNLRECQRYYAKSCGYSQAYPVNGTYRCIGRHAQSSTSVRLNIRFPVQMAKVGTPVIHSVDGSANIYLDGTGNVAMTGTPSTFTTGMYNCVTAASQTTPYPNAQALGQWSHDTGW